MFRRLAYRHAAQSFDKVSRTGILTCMKLFRLGTVLPLAFAVTVSAQQAPDFRLRDVNPNSSRANALVSPRDYVLQVSGYYFGAAG
jgi:hypothetical protein